MDRSTAFWVIIIALIVFLSVTLVVEISTQNDPDSGEWSFNISKARFNLNMYSEDNDTLYTVCGSTLYAINPDGNLKWSVVLPGSQSKFGNLTEVSIYSAASAGGNEYFIVEPVDDGFIGDKGELLAVSSEGELLWSRPCVNLHSKSLLASGPTVYMYDNCVLTALNPDGTYGWELKDVQYHPSFDERGQIYAIQYLFPDGGWALKSCHPDGTISWSRNLSDLGLGPVEKTCALEGSVYHNGSVYVFANNGIAAISQKGTFMWSKNCGGYTFPMGFDSIGNLYAGCGMSSGDSYFTRIVVLATDGSEVATWDFVPCGAGSVLSDGVLYDLTYEPFPGDASLEHLNSIRVSAYDVIKGEQLWSHVPEYKSQRTVTLNGGSVESLLPWYDPVPVTATVRWTDFGPTTEPVPAHVEKQIFTRVIAGEELIYVSYWVYNYEDPVVLDRSRCSYAGGISAFDRHGGLVWEKPMDTYVTGMAENNGTIYYQTGDGKLSSATVDVTAGAIAAAAYLLLRFLAAGTVTRARSQLNKNQNRNEILSYICESPGPTQHEIARHLGINLGTVRYHLLVLSLNHKITAYTDETKFIRYFKNSHSYSEEEKLVIALIRREPIRKLLTLTLEGRCSSNVEIARELNMPESAVSKYLRELQGCKVVIKSAGNREAAGYTIDEQYIPILKGYLASQVVL